MNFSLPKCQKCGMTVTRGNHKRVCSSLPSPKELVSEFLGNRNLSVRALEKKYSVTNLSIKEWLAQGGVTKEAIERRRLANSLGMKKRTRNKCSACGILDEQTLCEHCRAMLKRRAKKELMGKADGRYSIKVATETLHNLILDWGYCDVEKMDGEIKRLSWRR